MCFEGKNVTGTKGCGIFLGSFKQGIAMTLSVTRSSQTGLYLEHLDGLLPPLRSESSLQGYRESEMNMDQATSAL